jgi:rubrerythrin
MTDSSISNQELQAFIDNLLAENDSHLDKVASTLDLLTAKQNAFLEEFQAMNQAGIGDVTRSKVQLQHTQVAYDTNLN